MIEVVLGKFFKLNLEILDLFINNLKIIIESFKTETYASFFLFVIYMRLKLERFICLKVNLLNMKDFYVSCINKLQIL